MSVLERFLFKSKNSINIQLASRGIALVNIIQIILLFPNYYDIYGTKGVSRSTLNFLFAAPLDLNIDKIRSILGLSDFIIVNVMVAFWLLLSVLILKEGCGIGKIFFLWLIHLVLVNSSFLFSYGADYMITFGLSFLLGVTLISKAQHYFSLPITEAEILSFATRTLQLFVCIVYFFGGLGKVIGHDWFNGDAMWKVMAYFQYDITRQAYHALPSLFWVVPGWIFMFAELLYPVLVNTHYTRRYVLAVIVCMHLGIALFLNLYIFALIMIYFNFISFKYLISNNNDSDKGVELLAQQV
jgi:hypothetical protein